uniref:Dystroglycan 1 n=2 Tax=Scleropages formosus TaxID=113540 RepID=A0A8C9WR75_SCLFO
MCNKRKECKDSGPCRLWTGWTVFLVLSLMMARVRGAWPAGQIEILGDLSGQLEASMHSSVLADLQEAPIASDAAIPAGFPDSSAIVGRLFQMRLPTKMADASSTLKVFSMTDNAVPCTVKSPVPLQIGDAKTDTSRPGVYVIDVTFPHGQAVKIREISFKNYYTAFLMVRLQKKDPGSPGGCARWVTCLKNHPLMSSPHTEEGSQDYFSIYRHQMLVDPDDVTSVRLILRQPSSAWLNFTLEDIRIHQCASDDSERDMPAWFSQLTPVDQVPDLQGLPNPQTVASSIQQMWALTEVMQTNQTAAPIGRFDSTLQTQDLQLAR